MSYNNLRNGRWSAPGQEYLVTTVVSGRRPVFVDIESARPVIEILRGLGRDGSCHWLAWVLMPDHFHGLVSLDGDVSLSEVMRRFKGNSARKWNRSYEGSESLWQPNFHDRALRADEDRRVMARYIIGNPVRSGLVQRVGDYPFWDAVWLNPLSG